MDNDKSTSKSNIFRITVDCESDWGGRSEDLTGIGAGIPYILAKFKEFNIKSIFFVSTELLPFCRKELRQIIEAGHEIGSHGHFHIAYKDKWRWEIDRDIAETLLTPYKAAGQKTIHYRAPKFNREDLGDVYSRRKSHVSLLKALWFKKKITAETMIYLHPFDLVGGKKPPNLFCKIWYSRPKDACKLFQKVVELYPSYIH